MSIQVYVATPKYYYSSFAHFDQEAELANFYSELAKLTDVDIKPTDISECYYMEDLPTTEASQLIDFLLAQNASELLSKLGGDICVPGNFNKHQTALVLSSAGKKPTRITSTSMFKQALIDVNKLAEIAQNTAIIGPCSSISFFYTEAIRTAEIKQQPIFWIY